MTRRTAAAVGLMLGIAGGLVVIIAVVRFLPPRGADEAAAPAAAAEDAGAAADRAADATETAEEQATGVRTLPVRVYQRAGTRELALTPVSARIVWFDSPVERARQLVRHVIDGVAARGAYGPAPRGLRYREVYLDDARTAWVDLDGEGARAIAGADVEEAVVACLARTLVDNLEEVQRVGILVDGEPRRTLAGHVDISRTFDGREWPTL